MGENVVPFDRGHTPETEEQARERVAKERAVIVELSEPLYAWAGEQLRGDGLPPWDWYKLMFLRDAIDRVRGPAGGARGATGEE